MFFYLALAKSDPFRPKMPIFDFALNAPISCMDTARKLAPKAHISTADLQSGCRNHADLTHISRRPMRGKAPEKRMGFDNDCTVNMRSPCKHPGAVSIFFRSHKRDGGADERPAGATAKSLA